MSAFQEAEFSQHNPLLLSQLTNALIAKQLQLWRIGSLSQTIYDFLDYLYRNGLVCQVYKNHVLSVLNKQGCNMADILADQHKDEPSSEATVINQELDVVLNLNNRAEKYINKNFGYALLDLNADIIWCDQNTQQFFELQDSELKGVNLFDLMTN